MPWKLVAFIAVMSIVLVFVGFNLDNRCDISIMFVKFEQVPVVITILASFVLGLLAALVLSFGRGAKAKKAMATPKTGPARADAPANGSPMVERVDTPSPAKGKKRLFSKKR